MASKKPSVKRTNSSGGSLVWLRRDLRLSDNRAIAMAVEEDGPVHVAFIFDTTILAHLPRQDRRVEFIHQAVTNLALDLEKLGGALHCQVGNPVDLIARIASQLGVDRVIAAEDYEPDAVSRDEQVLNALRKKDIELHLVKDHVIFAKTEVLTGSEKPYTVFTPYKKKWLASLQPSDLQSSSGELNQRLATGPVKRDAPGVPSLEKMGFEKTNLDELGIGGSENAAHETLDTFEDRIAQYDEQRDFPAVKGVSYLSVHLRFGTVSIREAARRAYQVIQAQPKAANGASTWLSELVWRDFYFQILHNFPHVAQRSFKPAYDRIQWADDPDLFQSWCTGQTGYPLVDAAMAQINSTGYMHNRLRMVVASFLTKDLGIHWQWGERYFAEHLNDFDLSANNGGWQWASSSGCDAQPYFRIFNPITQSRRFDPKGKFIRRYVPQLADLSDKHIHAPWEAPAVDLAGAGVTLGENYPRPIVDHAEARKLTLARYEVVK
jgi:deoxyribodipyrimidine photo-lyase